MATTWRASASVIDQKKSNFNEDDNDDWETDPDFVVTIDPFHPRLIDFSSFIHF